MNKTLLALTIAMTFAGQTQAATQSSTKAKKPASTTTAAPASQTSSAPVAEVAPAAKKISVKVISENAATVTAANTMKASDIPVASFDAVGVAYKATETQTVELRQNFGYGANRENLGSLAPFFKEAFEMMDTTFIYKQSTGMKIANSNALTLGFRYDAPTGRFSSDNKRLGTFRIAETSAAWNATPKIEIGFALSPRVTVNSKDNPNASVGSDTLYRLVSGPSATYNINDKLNGYYALTSDMRSTDLGRGEIAMRNGNYLTHEVGGNITAGGWTINPAITSDLDLNTKDGFALGTNDRAWAEENNSYNLNFYGTF